MDHLTRTVIAAEKAGMSYGKYVALQYERNGYRTTPRSEAPVAEEEIRRCAVCGMPLKPGAHGLRKTCSRTCSDELNRRRNKGYYQKKKGEPGAVKAVPVLEAAFPDRTTRCRNCGVEFSLIGIHGGRKHCSKRCRMDYANRAAREKYANEGKERRKKQKKIKSALCGFCGKEFVVSRHCRRYCSDECAHGAMLAKERERDTRRREAARKEKYAQQD